MRIPILKRLLPACMLAAMLLNACGGGNAGGGNNTHLTIAQKNFTEGLLLGSLTKQLLQKHGYNVTLKEINGNQAIRQGLTSGQFDGYWEYTGTALVDYLNAGPIGNPDQACSKAAELDAKNNIVWLTPCAPMNDQDVLLIKQSNVATFGGSLSQLATYVSSHPNTSFCLQSEFVTRPAGLPALKAKYGLDPKNIKNISEGIAFQALASGQCDVGQGFGTDGRIPKFGLHVVQDDKFALPSDNVALTMRKSVTDANPGLKDIVSQLSQKLTTDVMTDLNKQVDVDQKSVDAVARDFLQKNGLV